MPWKVLPIYFFSKWRPHLVSNAMEEVRVLKKPKGSALHAMH